VTGYIKLNSGPVTSGAINYHPTTTAVTTIGRHTGNNFAFNGTIEEVWFSTDAPGTAAFDAIYARAIAQPGAGYRFPDTSGTVLHLLGRDYADAVWTAPQATLTTEGTVASATYSATSPIPTKARRYGVTPAGSAGTTLGASAFYRLAGPSPLAFTGNFSACVVAIPTAADIAGTSIYTSSGVSEGTPGWQLVNELGETYLLGTGGNAVTDVTATAGQVNVICFGKVGANGVLKVNDRPMKSAGMTITAGAADEGRIGMHWDYLLGFGGTILEAWYSTSTPTDALFSDIVAHVLLAP
jgi:hypothetical protein